MKTSGNHEKRANHSQQTDVQFKGLKHAAFGRRCWRRFGGLCRLIGHKGSPAAPSPDWETAVNYN